MDPKAANVQKVIEATRLAEAGLASCIVCKSTKPFAESITVMYGGSLVLAMCMACAEMDNQLMIRRGPLGIEVLKCSGGQRVAAAPGLGVLMKRPA